jgi:hypothetical protein
MESAADSNPREKWDRPVLPLIALPHEGWESEYEEITRREIERLAVPVSESGRDERP